jgi:hypothetical protein
MNDKPILFSAPMIRALLAGTKTQTRRTSGLADVNENPDAWSLHNVGPLGYMAKPSAKGKLGATFESRQIEPGALHVCPQRIPIAPGDRLWVKETWRVRSEFNHLSPTKIGEDEGAKSAIGVWYEADDNKGTLIELGRTRSSIHMPRWASRLTLMVTDVRVQRLQEISEMDAKAEGARPDRYGGGMAGMYAWAGLDPDAYARGFRTLWDSINGPDAWDQNPWVAAYSVDVHRGNIDQMGG